MAGALIWQVLDALVDLFSANLSVPVIDGALATIPSDPAWLMVGATELPPNINGEDFQSESSRSDFGNGEFSDEQGFVTCAVWAQSGDTSAVKQTRDAAGAIVEQCDALIQADPTLGGILGYGHYAQLGAVRGQQGQTLKGCSIRVTFTVTYTALQTP